eukprot:TRINITY_DN10018_c0_g1_i2.p1 TRINITY_DN10018_c0_g1~~TRINITY_DN10018_c0_g1_i2.p1  ORF type:complete len:503 (+),score=88.79 TRINITY_DN10018_c0_g1_i2:75-1583(+)
MQDRHRYIMTLKSEERPLLTLGSTLPPNQIQPKATRTQSLQLYSLIVLTILGGVLFGFEISVMSGAMLILEHDPDYSSALESSFNQGFMISAFVIGAMFGSSLAGMGQERAGRKWTIILAASVYMFGVGISIASHSYAVLFIGRLVTGFSVGLLCTTVPLYIAELSPKAVRGTLVTSNQLFICVGILLGFVVDNGFKCKQNLDFCTSHQLAHWKWMLLSALPIAIVLQLGFILFAPMTPRFLVKQGREREAQRVLMMFNHPRQATQELSEVIAANEQPVATWKDVLQPNVLYGIYIGAMLSAIQQFSGVNAVNFYAQTVITDAGFSKSKAFFFSIFIGVIKVFFVGMAMLFIDRAGRRILMMIGITGMSISTLILASMFQIREEHGDLTSQQGWIALIALFCFMGFYEISLGPAVWLYLSEIFPLNVKGKALSVSGVLNWVFTLAVSQSFPIMMKAWYAGGVFFLFGGLCVVSGMWIVAYLPETKGKSLEEIEVEFRARASR